MGHPAYEFWLFDLDGTLVDVEAAYQRELLSRVGARLGVGFSEADCETIWHGSEGARRDLLAAKGVDEPDFWAAFDAVDDPAARVEATFLYPDAKAVGGLDGPAGLVTHCPAPVTRRVLAHLDIGDWFDAVVCCDESVGWKPAPEPIHRAVAELPIDDAPGDGALGVYAGDGPHDIGAAWNAGLDGIHVDRNDAVLRGRYVLADRRVRALTELLA